jgi:hypothetical protein
MTNPTNPRHPKTDADDVTTPADRHSAPAHATPPDHAANPAVPNETTPHGSLPSDHGMAQGFGAHNTVNAPPRSTEAPPQVPPGTVPVTPQHPPSPGVSPEVVAALKVKFPKFASVIDGGISLHGAPLVQSTSRMVNVTDTIQKYRLSDGTILPYTVSVDV